MIIAHGSYISDIRDSERRQAFQLVTSIPLRAAWEIAQQSSWVEFSKYASEEYPGDESFRNNAGLHNKCFVLLGVADHHVTALYNHDGGYSLFRAHVKPVFDSLCHQVVIMGCSRYSDAKRLAEEIHYDYHDVVGPLPWKRNEETGRDEYVPRPRA